MLNLASTKTKRNLHLISAAKEATGMILLGFHIMLFDTDTELNFFDGNDLLILTGFLLAFCLFKAILAVIHDLAHGWIGLGGDLYKIKPFFIGDLLSVASRLNSQLGPVGINKSNLSISNFFVELKFLCADGKTPPK